MFADVFFLRDQDLFEPLRRDLLHLDSNHSNSNSSTSNSSTSIGESARRGGVGTFSGGAFGKGQGQGRASYVLHSLGLCEALTHRLARHTSPCLGSSSGFSAVWAVRAGGPDVGQGSDMDNKDKNKEKEDDDDVFWFDGHAAYPQGKGDDAAKAGAGLVPQAVAGAVERTAQSWRIMRRLVAEVSSEASRQDADTLNYTT